MGYPTWVSEEQLSHTDLNTTVTNEWKGRGFRNNINAGATINGGTLPVPVYQNPADNELYACDADVITKLQFIGFAISNSTDGNPIDFQANGIVTGFSGLNEGRYYYVQDAVGTIGETRGRFSVLVGMAISATELLIIKKPLTLLERAAMNDGGYFSCRGKDWTAASTGGSGSATNNLLIGAVAANAGSSDDDGKIEGTGLEKGDTSSTQTLSYDLGCEFAVYVEGGGGSTTYEFFGFAPKAHPVDGDTETFTAQHIGFFWTPAGTLYISNANGSTQTKTSIGSITGVSTLRLFSFDYDGVSIRFYVDNVLVGTHTTNLPTGSMVVAGAGAYIWSDSQGGSTRFSDMSVHKDRSYWVASLV